jgi:predicted transcriptional regulator
MITSKKANCQESNTKFDKRKGIRINDFQNLGWDPEYIRQRLDQMSYTKFDYLKQKLSNNHNHTIRLTQGQAEKWDPDIIRHFLNVKQDVCQEPDVKHMDKSEKKDMETALVQMITFFDTLFHEKLGDLEISDSGLKKIFSLIDKNLDEDLIEKIRRDLL